MFLSENRFRNRSKHKSERKIAVVLCVLFSLMACLPAAAVDNPQLDEFVRLPHILSVKISPDGKKLGVVVMEEGRRALAFIELETMEFSYVLRFRGDEEVGDFYWVNGDRVLAEVLRTSFRYEGLVFEGRLYAINYNGRSGRMVYGNYYWERKKAPSRGKRYSKGHVVGHVSLISTMSSDRTHVLVSTHPWVLTERGYFYRRDRVGSVLKLNVYSGDEKAVMVHPARGGRAFADSDGVVRFATGYDLDERNVFFQRVDNNWLQLEADAEHFSWPVGYSKNGQFAYLLSNKGANTLGLIRFDLAQQTRETIFRDHRVDVDEVLFYPGSEEPMALLLENGKPSYHFLDESNEYSKFFRGVVKAFDGQRVTISSATADGSLAILKVSSDVLPGDYFLANRKTRKVDFLLSSAEWLDPEKLSHTEVFDYASRDGIQQQSYLTFPRNVSRHKNLPMIVMPHGGPAARDYWNYDRVVQLLASQGYLVLQPNFRGSSGYGLDMQRAAYGEWGKRVQDDISDAVHSVVEKGFADKHRLCIFGSSFGAYSAMMSAIREPHLYKCAAGFAGIYDLNLLYTKGDIRKTSIGQRYLHKSVGVDAEELRSQSPVNLADQLKVPLFIAHGGEDDRAPLAHAKSLIKAVKRQGLEVDVHIIKKGGHGFHTEQANRSLYSDLLAFLSRHMNG